VLIKFINVDQCSLLFLIVFSKQKSEWGSYRSVHKFAKSYSTYLSVIFKKFNEFYSSTKLYIFSRYLFLILKMLLDDVLYFIRVCIFTAF